MKPAILVIDTGSSSMRGILFDLTGRMLFTEQLHYFMHTDSDGTAEQDPADYKDSLHTICRRLAQKARKEKLHIEALSFTSQRSSVLPVTADGAPLGPIVTWYDKRSTPFCQGPEIDTSRIYALSGQRLTPVLSAPKMRWLKENRPDTYKSAYRLIGIHDYLLFLATGRFVTDQSLATRSCLMDITDRTWSDELLGIFELDKGKLCELVSPGSVIGTLTPKFAEETGLPAETKVVTAGGDQQCSALGQALFTPGRIGITSGTGAYLTAACSRPVFDSMERVNVSASALPGHWLLEASTISAGSAYNWFNQTFFPEDGRKHSFDALNQEISRIAPGADGVIALPGLAGKGCPDYNNFSRGLFFNIGFETTKAHFARALLEGIAAEIAECHSILTGLTGPAASVNSTGGLADFPVFNQVIADMIDSPVSKGTVRETTAAGAFFAAFLALYPAPSLSAAWSALEFSAEDPLVFEPSPERTRLYARQAQARRLLYDAIPHQQLYDLLNS